MVEYEFERLVELMYELDDGFDVGVLDTDVELHRFYDYILLFCVNEIRILKEKIKSLEGK